MRNEDGYHIMPGGRRETGESLEQTLRREVGEEAGWAIDEIRLLGFSHFHHLTPVPVNHPHPYSDFFNIIYTAEAMTPLPHVRLVNDYEIEAEFRPVEVVRPLLHSGGEQFFLDLALRLRGGTLE
jgi:8-oxo-dGTP pyrophosphatase MutT (NUDIX family)